MSPRNSRFVGRRFVGRGFSRDLNEPGRAGLAPEGATIKLRFAELS